MLLLMATFARMDIYYFMYIQICLQSCHCWLGIRKRIQAVKIEWISVWSEVQIVYIWFSWCNCHPKSLSSLALFKSRLILPFWYRLTQVILEKRPLSGCSSSSSYIQTKKLSIMAEKPRFWWQMDSEKPRFLCWLFRYRNSTTLLLVITRQW